MQQHMKPWLKDKIFIVAFLVTFAILYLSLKKMPNSDINISHLDKVQHSIAYFILSISWLFAFAKKRNKITIVAACILFGILIEILQQTVTNYRTGDYLDVIANSVGVLLGLLLFNQFSRKKNV